jgi:predicted ester cyclase
MPRWFLGKGRQARETHPPPAAAETSLEANKAVVRRYLEEVTGTGDVTLVEALFAPIMFERVRQAVGNLHTAFPGWQLTIEEMLAEGDQVAVHWVARGTHLGPFGDFAPTGNPVTWSEIYVMQLADGKIVGGLREANIHDVYRQLGGQVVAPGPAQAQEQPVSSPASAHEPGAESGT